MSETHPPRRLLRSIGAVLAGMVAVIILSLGTDAVLHATGIYPPWGERMADALFVLATAYRIVYTVAGGYIAARLAPGRPMLHAMVFGAIGVVVGVIGAVATWSRLPELGPKWYAVAIFAIALPCAWAGGRLYATQLRPRAN